MLIIYKNNKQEDGKCKGIYAINFENGKKYIGMSNLIRRRLIEHINDSKQNDILPVHKAMRKYQYTFEILEKCDKDCSRKELGEKEKYWINFYQSYTKDNGYNLTIGGDGANFGIMNSSSKLSENQLAEIYNKLINDKNKYIYEIAQEYNISPTAVSEINNGKRYYNSFLNYPLRTIHWVPKNKKGIENHLAVFKTQDDIEKIYYDLEYSDLTLQQIANKYKVSYTTISKINRGLEYINEKYSYPIRKHKRNLKLNNQQIKEIYDLLMNSSKSLNEISKEYQVSIDTIRRLNNGKTYTINGYTYPIRANKEINKAVSTISVSGE